MYLTGNGNDTVALGANNNVLSTGSGNLSMTTRAGNDTIYGGNYVICVPSLAEEMKRFVGRVQTG